MEPFIYLGFCSEKNILQVNVLENLPHLNT